MSLWPWVVKLCIYNCVWPVTFGVDFRSIPMSLPQSKTGNRVTPESGTRDHGGNVRICLFYIVTKSWVSNKNSLKLNKGCTCYFKRKLIRLFLSNDKVEIVKQKLEFWKMFICYWNLKHLVIFKVFFQVNNTKICDLWLLMKYYTVVIIWRKQTKGMG